MLGSGFGGRHHVQHRHMPRAQRLAVYWIVGILWLSGCVWLALDLAYAKRGPFRAAPHPLQPPLLLMHGVVAIASMYLFGWIGARHVLYWWPAGLKRFGGVVLATLTAVLGVSGFLLFFLSDDAAQRLTAVLHEILGVAISVAAIQHWFFGKRGRRSGR
jgi:hypothetical protein